MGILLIELKRGDRVAAEKVDNQRSCLFLYFYICKIFFCYTCRIGLSNISKHIHLYQDYTDKNKTKTGTDELYSLQCVHIPSNFTSCQFWPI